MKLSLVVIARNEGVQLRRTVENLLPTLPDSSEIVVVDDGSEDGSADFLATRRGNVRLFRTRAIGVARARNYGARRTRGDILVFADAHIRVEPGWWQPFARALENPSVGAVAPAILDFDQSSPRSTTGYGLTFTGPDQSVRWLPKRNDSPFPAPILPGCCLGMSQDTFRVTGGWDDGLLQRGGVDNELSLRLWLLGYRQLILPGIEVRHLFRRRSPFPVDWARYLHNRLRLGLVHLSPERIGKVLAALSGHAQIGEALLLAIENGAFKRRRELSFVKVKNDHWYFEKFGIEW